MRHCINCDKAWSEHVIKWPEYPNSRVCPDRDSQFFEKHPPIIWPGLVSEAKEEDK